jgi:hypothetical protein
MNVIRETPSHAVIRSSIKLIPLTYEQYRKLVIEACCNLMGMEHRAFWETQCSWEEEFEACRSAAEVAQDQYDSLT